MKYQPIIGLEVHVELKTSSKMFCGCSADYFGKEPNTHCCPVCLGLPGALPVPNKKAIEWCVMIGLSLNCQIPLFSKFDRKNYFYPDLPKGYQISQYDEPFCINGWIEISPSNVVLGRSAATTPESPSPKVLRDSGQARMTKKRIRIRRVHMEEDTAKLIHQFGVQSSKRKAQNNEGYSLIDFNRSGVPLVEIVTEPDFESASEVVEYLKKLQQIVRYLEVSDADMEKGEMRLEPNISLSKVSLRGEKRRSNPKVIATATSWLRDEKTTVLPTYKVEIKNINSFRFVEKAINYEIERQSKIIKSGKIPTQETRGWDDKKEVTVSQRTKEEAHDYRYFPESDIPPFHWTKFQILNLKSQMPELSDQKYLRFQKDYGLSTYDNEILTRDKAIADYFEETIKISHKLKIKSQKYANVKTIANWIINKKIDINNLLPAQFIHNIVISKQTSVIDTKKLEKIVSKVLEENKKAVEDYIKGKNQVIGFLIGQVRHTIKQPIDTMQIKEAIEKLLKIR